VQNPQKFLLSSKGSWFGAVAGGGLAYYYKNKEAKALIGKKREEVWVTQNPHQLMGTVVAIAAIGGLLGAKIFHNLENIDELMADPIGSLLSFSGLTFYGGLIVAAVGILYYTKKNGIPPLIMCDSTAAGLMLSYGIGRIGCHLSGDGDWGIVNTAPKPNWMSMLPDWMWSFKFPHNVNNEGVPIPGCVGRWCSELPEPVYPTSFYETLMAIALFAILWGIRKKINIPGMLFSIYLIMNGTERFLIESIRVNSLYHIMGIDVTQAQLISSALIILGIFGVWYTRKNQHTLQNGKLS
jgi:prolipoprotein diacylglyceryltransferase